MSESAPVERELKFGSVELSKLKESLEELEAERRSSASFEDNWIFDRDDELESRDCLLRVRMDGNGARITFKGPATVQEQTTVRKEVELEVRDGEAAQRLLRELGYRVTRRYQKYREEWYLGGVVIALDHTPIGDFAEFEGDGAATVARRCGFEIEDALSVTYLTLYDLYRTENPDAPAEMIFREG